MQSNIRLLILFAIACVAGLANALLALPANAGTNTWTAIGPYGANNPYGTPFAVDPSSPSTIYSMLNGTTIMKTTDGGGHWDALATSPANFKSLMIDPASPTTIYALGGTALGLPTSIYKSVDGAATWVSETNGLDGVAYIQLLAIAPSRSSTLYVLPEFQVGVLRSIDGGASWTKIDTAFEAWKLAIDPTNADVVYVGTVGSEAKIFKSTNGGEQWRQLPISLPAEADVEALAVDPITPSVVYATYSVSSGNDILVEAGMFKTIDGGETWTVAQKWILGQSPPSDPILDAMSLAIDPSAPWRIFATTNRGVYMSSDAAASWVPINSGLPFPVWGIDIDRTGSILRTASYTGLFEYRLTPAAPEVRTAIEYGLTTVWDYGGYFSYFVTSAPAEIAALDAGALNGCCGYLWQRTGETFDVWTSPSGGALPTCRFLYEALSIDHNISTLNLDHFYTPYSAECAAVQARPDWQYEGIAFYLRLPGADGLCPPGTNVLYRLYNNGIGGGPAHRFTTSTATIDEMRARYWIVEGNDPTVAFACVPSSAPPSTR
jgi:photosystem II stability/assembly factor-like uncharacterized protein